MTKLCHLRDKVKSPGSVTVPAVSSWELRVLKLQRSDTTAAPQNHPGHGRSGGLPARRLSLQPNVTIPKIRRSPSPKKSPKSVYKVLILGATKVGKSAIIARFMYDSFDGKYKRTVEELHRAEFNVGGSILTLDILDTSGSHEFPAMRALNIQSSDAFILVYSVEESDSFDEVKRLHAQVLESAKHPNPSIVLVGNKSDTEDFNVEACKGRDLSHSWSCGFVECSAKTGEGINSVFKELLKQANIQYKLSPALRKRRMSLPSGQQGPNQGNSSQQITPSQLESLREKQSNKRNSCSVT
ncbi:unnamed protein product [Allacma fusca]|uniref:Uncharacterized protein n=1 Tax=Allacma fusca TaxID=39272 RepID=A0A8J2JHQ2_9HEXA|nr:unnamed protein product [Allacma fusca]